MIADTENKEQYKRYIGAESLQVMREKNLPVIDGEECDLTVMLADVRDFTSFSETNSPRQVIDILNDYFDIIVKTVFDYGGAVDKFMGDCVMAVFGAPASGLSPKYKNHALTAVECALECRRKIRKHSLERKNNSEAALKVGYTLNSGRAIAGHFGSAHRKDYSVIGDMVNTCARIEKFVDEDGILAGQQTYTIVRDNIKARKKPATKIKGKTQLVHIYEILELIENG